jgi:hypothetical protein
LILQFEIIKEIEIELIAGALVLTNEILGMREQSSSRDPSIP